MKIDWPTVVIAALIVLIGTAPLWLYALDHWVVSVGYCGDVRC